MEVVAAAETMTATGPEGSVVAGKTSRITQYHSTTSGGIVVTESAVAMDSATTVGNVAVLGASSAVPTPRGLLTARVPAIAAMGRCRTAHPAGLRRTGDERESDTWLERVKRQVEFYFSDANLRRDKFM